MRIVDGSTNKTSLLVNNRLRLPRLTTTERTALTDLNQGDVVFDQTSQRLYLYGSSWLPLISQRTRNIVLPATVLRSRTGTNPIADFGVYPGQFSAVLWSGSSPAKDGVGIDWVVPEDFVPGTSMTFKVLWAYSGPAVQNWVCEFNFLSAVANDPLTAGGTTLSATISANRGPANNLLVDTIGTSSVGLDPGELLRINVNRNAPHASDNYTGQVRLISLVITYQSA